MNGNTLLAFLGFCFFAMLTITITASTLYPSKTDQLRSFMRQCSGGYQSEMIRCAEMAQKLGLNKLEDGNGE